MSYNWIMARVALIGLVCLSCTGRTGFERLGPFAGDEVAGDRDSVSGDGSAGDPVAGDSPAGDPSRVSCSGVDTGTYRGAVYSLMDGGSVSNLSEQIWTLDSSWTNTQGLLGLWRLDEDPVSDGTTMANAVTGNPGGTMVTGGAAVTIVPGKIGVAPKLDGIDDYVRIDADPLFVVDSELTLMAWVRLAQLPSAVGNAFAIGHKDGDFTFRIVEGFDCLRFIVSQPTVQPAVGATGCRLEANLWYHVVATHSDSAMRLYLNGDEVGFAVPPVSGLAFSPSTIAIGADAGAGNSWFNGAIDEFSIWSRELDPSQIEQVYRRQVPLYSGAWDSEPCDAGTDVSWSTLEPVPIYPFAKPIVLAQETAYRNGDLELFPLVGLWHLDGPPGLAVGDAADASNYGNHGTLTDGDDSMEYVTGRFNQGIDFDGLDDAITLPTLTLGSQFTVAAWVKPKADSRAPGGFAGIVCDAGNVRCMGDVNRVLYWRDDEVDHLFGSAMAPFHWHHVAITYDGASVRAYVIFAAAGDYAPSGAYLPMVDSFWIGADQRDEYYPGIIDEVVILNRALDNTEVNLLYDRGARRIEYQARTCDTPTCGGVAFVGPDLTPLTSFTEESNDSALLPVFDLSPLPARRYLQIRAILATEHPTIDTHLADVTVR